MTAITFVVEFVDCRESACAHAHGSVLWKACSGKISVLKKTYVV
jgi:hypothetical protein